MPRLSISLSDDVYDAIEIRATRERRSLSSQIDWTLRRQLITDGHLTDPDATDGTPTE